jgi:flagellar secretion chaperone FliS
VDANVSKYMTQQVMTASPAKLVFMLYDRAIVSLREAIKAIEIGDVERRWKANNRAVEIVSHLWSTLDTENGGEIAKNLENLLPFITRQLTRVDLNNDAGAAEEAILLLEPLRDAWREISMAQGTAGPRPRSGPRAEAGASAAARPDAAAQRTSFSV